MSGLIKRTSAAEKYRNLFNRFENFRVQKRLKWCLTDNYMALYLFEKVIWRVGGLLEIFLQMISIVNKKKYSDTATTEFLKI